MLALLNLGANLSPERGRRNVESIEGADFGSRTIVVAVEGARAGSGFGEGRGDDSALR